jgi:hypothetical protein
LQSKYACCVPWGCPSGANVTDFWGVTLYNLVHRHQQFERVCWLHLQGRGPQDLPDNTLRTFFYIQDRFKKFPRNAVQTYQALRCHIAEGCTWFPRNAVQIYFAAANCRRLYLVPPKRRTDLLGFAVSHRRRLYLVSPKRRTNLLGFAVSHPSRLYLVPPKRRTDY